MPDFDVDFSDERRQQVIDYVSSKNTVPTMWRRSSRSAPWRRALAIRDVGRAMAIPYATRQIPSQSSCRWQLHITH